MKNHSIFLTARPFLAALFFASALALPAAAQDVPPADDAPVAAPPAAKNTPPGNQGTAAPAAPVVDRTHRTIAQNVAEAWSTLKTAAADPKKPDDRVAAVAAIGTIQGSPVAHKLIADALNDPSLDVRLAAILAVGTLKDKGLHGKLRIMMDDKEPQIVFTAATTLWKLDDKSGEDILMSVIDGDRKTDAGLVKGTERSANKDLHNPVKLAEFGARQGAGYLLGPFGYGITAWDYAHQHPGENPRVAAINLLSTEKTANVRATLIDALDDKDQQVRAAAACALGDYPGPATGAKLLITFDDGKLPVRMLGAASYIRVSSPATRHSAARKKK